MRRSQVTYRRMLHTEHPQDRTENETHREDQDAIHDQDLRCVAHDRIVSRPDTSLASGASGQLKLLTRRNPTSRPTATPAVSLMSCRADESRSVGEKKGSSPTSRAISTARNA